jgi:serine/threonine protein kinase
MARDLARGLADLHAYRPIHDCQRKNRRGLPAVCAHHDINLTNLIRTNRTTKNGVISRSSAQNVQIKWNDSNLGILLRHYKNGTACPIPVRHFNPLWRSPEEIENTNNTMTGDSVVVVHGTQAVVYSFGSLLFLLVARHQPWWYLEPKKPSIEMVMQQKMAGEMPHMPSRYIDKMQAKILWEAIQACYRLDPQTRPTAYELAQAIGTAYNWIRDSKNKKVSPSSLCEHYSRKRPRKYKRLPCR